MNYYNIRQPSQCVSFKDAVMQGLAADQGLYMPEWVRSLPKEFLNELPNLSFPEIALTVALNMLNDDLPPDEIRKLIDRSITFDAPLVRVEEDVYSLELFRGPTLAFKDFGARFLANLMSLFAADVKEKITVLVATSGDTGGAVANGFAGVEGTRVVVLYPQHRVSQLQEKQFTTLGGNITALEVKGTFDDCQRMVKQAFVDEACRQQLLLTSANSINIGRLIPQTFYYFRALAQLPKNQNVVVAVPSGNFGNLTAGLLAKGMGLRIRRFIAATNANDIVPQYMASGIFSPKPSVATLSTAMDVGNPSNFERMIDLYAGNHTLVKQDVHAIAISDAATKDAMRDIFANKGYIMDPHAAVAYQALRLLRQPDESAIFLETAHPAKFKDEVEEILGLSIDIPEALRAAAEGEKRSILIEPTFQALKDVLLQLP